MDAAGGEREDTHLLRPQLKTRPGARVAHVAHVSGLLGPPTTATHPHRQLPHPQLGKALQRKGRGTATAAPSKPGCPHGRDRRKPWTPRPCSAACKNTGSKFGRQLSFQIPPRTEKLTSKRNQPWPFGSKFPVYDQTCQTAAFAHKRVCFRGERSPFWKSKHKTSMPAGRRLAWQLGAKAGQGPVLFPGCFPSCSSPCQHHHHRTEPPTSPPHKELDPGGLRFAPVPIVGSPQRLPGHGGRGRTGLCEGRAGPYVMGAPPVRSSPHSTAVPCPRAAPRGAPSPLRGCCFGSSSLCSSLASPWQHPEPNTTRAFLSGCQQSLLLSVSSPQRQADLLFIGIPTPSPAAPPSPRPPPQPGARLGLAQLQPGWSPGCFYPSQQAEALHFLPPRSCFLGYFLDTVPGSQLAAVKGLLAALPHPVGAAILEQG
ncbi:uncharacterized protein LOC118178414 [Oxyura jamaicensis]|uniref:uncharacterized protein LOC118178414 n=1 Tax=Oxyura jamaicensis TaxID=8884 RepID=UPI0015A64DE0|nr:uncharacterized protein LOC118178414 [Oxyura jamaicensis]